MSTRLAVLAALMFSVTVRADDPPKPPAGDKPSTGPSVLNPNANKPAMQSAGRVEARVGKVDGSTITLKLAAIEAGKGGGGSRRGRGGANLKRVEKDQDIDLAADVKVRWHDLPKKADGKSYSDKEYKAMLDPPGTPGYKADMSDLRSGQTVRVYLSKEAGKDAKAVATVVMILADAPKNAESKDAEKPKKKKKKE